MQATLENRLSSSTDLSSRILAAVGTIGPVWPLKNAIACNPLLHLENLSFWEAIETSIDRHHRLTTTDPIRTEFVNRQLIKWVQSYVDQGIAKIRMPTEQQGFYAAWKELVFWDRELIHSKEEQHLWNRLPENALDAVAFVLESIGLAEEEIDPFLAEQISQLPGWAGYIRWLSEWDSSSLSLIDFLAVRLGIYWIALQKKELDAPSSYKKVAPKKSMQREEIENQERSFALKFVRQLLEGLRKPKKRERPLAQWVFCIDVRSESYRHQLEQIGSCETFGFAGFFGLPVAIAHSRRGIYSSCPVLLKPKWTVIEEERNFRIFRRVFLKGKQVLQEVFRELKYRFGTPFSLAEAMGAWAGLGMVVKSILPYMANRFQKAFVSSQETFLLQSIPLKEQLDTAESALRMMGLVHFAPFVVLCGHASCSTNNPFASALDCGACGGNRGGSNARLLASILNSEAVRSGLSQRGICIPEETVFLSAEHNTTTDEIHFFEELSGSKDKETLQRDAKKASQANRLKRHLSFGEGENQRDKEAMRRSLDWSEVRPEWGLAKNGAFLIGPRSLSEGLDLEGRSFLHSYDWEKDPEGTFLETILTAPMVVAQWINAQYFFSTFEPILFGSGCKTTQNIVGKIGVMQGNGSDLMHGLPFQSVFALDAKAYHEPIRLLTVVLAPLERIDTIIERQLILQRLFYNKWVHLIAIDPQTNVPYQLKGKEGWQPWRDFD